MALETRGNNSYLGIIYLTTEKRCIYKLKVPVSGRLVSNRS